MISVLFPLVLWLADWQGGRLLLTGILCVRVYLVAVLVRLADWQGGRLLLQLEF